MKIRNNALKNLSVGERFINSARQMNLTKDKKWLKRLIDKNKIFYLDHRGDKASLQVSHQEMFTNRLFEMIDVFERKYDDNWDVHLKYDASRQQFEICFLINYDQITITNSNNQSRILSDLLVVLPVAYKIGTKNVYIRNIQGTRLTLEEDEWYSGYLHSHLPSIDKITTKTGVFLISNFCTGSEDLSELEIELSVDFDIEKFELMLYTIDSLVSWESLEGGPHKRMETIVAELEDTRVDTSDRNIADLYAELLKQYIKGELDNLPLDFVYVNNYYQIKHNDKFINFIKNAFLGEYGLKQYSNYVICKRGTDGYFYTNTSLREASDLRRAKDVLKNIKESCEGELPFVYIQGKKISFNINFLETTNSIDISEYGVYPKFLTYVSEQLESEIYKACVRGSAINKLQNTSNNVRSISEQNQVLM